MNHQISGGPSHPSFPRKRESRRPDPSGARIRRLLTDAAR